MQLKAQTRTHPSGSQSGRSAAIPLRSRSQTTLPRHPLPRSAQHLSALGPARYCSQACARGSSRSRPPRAAAPAPALRSRQLPGLRAPAPAPRPARCPAPARWLARSRAQACARTSGCARGRCRGRYRVRLQWRME